MNAGNPLKNWVVAYNLPTTSWTSGGKIEDYEHPHYDVFVVQAFSREGAETEARVLRRSHMNLTSRQRALLDNLKEELVAVGGQGSGRSIEIGQDERRQARALAQRGLLRFSGNDEDSREVFLNRAAFNPSLDPDGVRLARSAEHRLERRTPQATGRHKPGRL